MGELRGLGHYNSHMLARMASPVRELDEVGNKEKLELTAFHMISQFLCRSRRSRNCVRTHGLSDNYGLRHANGRARTEGDKIHTAFCTVGCWL